VVLVDGEFEEYTNCRGRWSVDDSKRYIVYEYSRSTNYRTHQNTDMMACTIGHIKVVGLSNSL